MYVTVSEASSGSLKALTLASIYCVITNLYVLLMLSMTGIAFQWFVLYWQLAFMGQSGMFRHFTEYLDF